MEVRGGCVEGGGVMGRHRRRRPAASCFLHLGCAQTGILQYEISRRGTSQTTHPVHLGSRTSNTSAQHHTNCPLHHLHLPPPPPPSSPAPHNAPMKRWVRGRKAELLFFCDHRPRRRSRGPLKGSTLTSLSCPVPSNQLTSCNTVQSAHSMPWR